MTYFLETIIFKARNYAFASFHRLRTLTCRTAGDTPLQYIIVPKHNMSQKNRSQGLKEPQFGYPCYTL